ncbi:MAG TPA: hypothetical protein VF974_00925 [Patescibacteria group bacterium]
MGVGNTPLGTDTMPLPTSIVPGTFDPVLAQGSTNTTTDGNNNKTTPVNFNLKQIGDVLFTLGQALKVASIPVVLPSDQIVSVAAGPALTPYGSNPVQTASNGADTQYKFGASGTTSFNHVSGQNNTPSNVYLAFDQSTTVSGNQVYVIAPGQAFAFDRAGIVLHFSSPAQQSFGGQSGITVEAFA